MWAAAGVSPREGVAGVKDRLMYLRLRDAARAAAGRGAGGRNTFLGRGAGNLRELFNELNRLNVRPLALTLDTSGVVNAPGDLFASVDAFETVVQPAYGANFTAFSKTRPIRWDLVTPARGETLSPAEIAKRSEEVRQKIDAAIPRQAYATPKKRRKMLVVESLLPLWEQPVRR